MYDASMIVSAAAEDVPPPSTV